MSNPAENGRNPEGASEPSADLTGQGNGQEKATAAKYIVWINHGYEGWGPTYCDGLPSVAAAIAQSYGSEYIVTRPFDWNGVLRTLEGR